MAASACFLGLTKVKLASFSLHKMVPDTRRWLELDGHKHGRTDPRTRAVGRSENTGVPVLFGGHNLPRLVEIGLTDLSKYWGAMAPLALPGTTGLSTNGRLLPCKVLRVV